MQLRTEKPNITAKNYLTVGPGEYPCGNNLYLIVTPSGGRRWAFRYQRNGGVKKMGLGSAKPAGLKLSEAKDKAIDALRLLAKGTDPREHRDDQKRREGSRLFGEFAEEWRQTYETGLKHKAARNKLKRIVQVITKPLHTSGRRIIRPIGTAGLHRSCRSSPSVEMRAVATRLWITATCPPSCRSSRPYRSKARERLRSPF